MGVSSKLETAIGMSLATTFVLTLSSVMSYLAYTYILIPLNLTYLQLSIHSQVLLRTLCVVWWPSGSGDRQIWDLKLWNPEFLPHS